MEKEDKITKQINNQKLPHKIQCPTNTTFHMTPELTNLYRKLVPF